jgi:hypothetical protein
MYHSKWSELVAILCGSALVTLGAVVGPLAVLAAHGFRFNLSLSLALLASILSAIGWLTALLLTKHPFFEEIVKVAEFYMPRLLASKPGVAAVSSPRTFLIRFDP